MPKIAKIRTVLLSSPYADPDDPEIKECFPNGAKRTIGMVEIKLDNGVTGIGEGYLAVFAPLVFKSIVDLVIGAMRTFVCFANAATRFLGARSLTTIVVNPACSSLTTLAFNGVRAIESKINRRIGFSICRLPSAICFRAVKLGSSANTVFTPTRMASLPRRRFIP